MAQIVDHRDLISTFQPGDLPASERIVRVYQNEMLRTAYLLTGSAEGAVLLARDSFLSYFRALVQGDTPDDPRLGLLQELGRTFLVDPGARSPDNGDRPGRALEGTVALSAEQQLGARRARVDDDRSRVVALLELLDRKPRLGIVLRDFNALDEEPVCQILAEIPYTLRQSLHPTRDRIRDVAGVGPDHSVRELLVNAATAAPRPNLWPEVAGPLEDFYTEEDERRQRITYVAAGVVGLLLVLAGLWLFDMLPFVSGDDNAAAIASTAGSTATPTAAPEPTITPTPIPALSSFAIPQGDVPSRILMNISSSGSTAASPGRNDYGYFDLDSETFSEYRIEGFPTPSPDGRKLIGFAIDVGPGGTEKFSLVALDSETAELLWETEVPQPTYSPAITGELVYVALLDAAGSGDEQLQTPELRAYDIETGELVETWPDAIGAVQTAVSDFVRVILFTSPDETRLFIAVEEFGSGPTLISSRSLVSYSLPDMTYESASIQTDSTASRQFPTDFSFYDSRVTPDGSFIYWIDAEDEIVQFRSSDASEDVDLPLPFAQERAPNENLQWITSNDGRYLSVLATRRAEVVLVDLLSRRVVRSFPLDFSSALESQMDAFRQQTFVNSGFGANLGLAHSGQFLYLFGNSDGSNRSGFIGETHVWTIDLSTWTVTNLFNVPDLVTNLTELDGELILMSQSRTDVPGPSSNMRTIDPVSGEVLNEFEGDGMPEWANSFYGYPLHEYYRFIYGRAPAVDHVAFEDVEIESTLPRISVVASDEAIPAGKTFDLGVRALNPVDGQRLTEDDPAVRFDLDSTVIVRLVHEDGEGEPVILVTNRTDPGRYEASSALMETGYWNAEVTVTGVDGRTRTFTAAEVFHIVPSWEASDGKRYILQVTTDPSEPAVDESAEVTARFVDIDSGAPLPEDAEILAELPSQIRVAFDSGDRGVASATLDLGESGLYEGNETFWTDGEWQTKVAFRLGDGEFIEVEVGTINVVE